MVKVHEFDARLLGSLPTDEYIIIHIKCMYSGVCIQSGICAISFNKNLQEHPSKGLSVIS